MISPTDQYSATSTFTCKHIQWGTLINSVYLIDVEKWLANMKTLGMIFNDRLFICLTKLVRFTAHLPYTVIRVLFIKSCHIVLIRLDTSAEIFRHFYKQCQFDSCRKVIFVLLMPYCQICTCYITKWRWNTVILMLLPSSTKVFTFESGFVYFIWYLYFFKFTWLLYTFLRALNTLYM